VTPRRLLFVVVLLALARAAHAQATPPPCAAGSPAGRLTFKPFTDRAWYAPLAANPRDAQSEILFWGRSDRFPYTLGDQALTFWEVSFGKEFPFVLWEPGEDAGVGVECGGWGFGVWAPLSFHMIDDVTGDSSPIINDDYRLGLAVKVAHGITPRDVLSAKIQLGHESTHLGDEFILNALRDFPDTFQRINVSYEYLEFGVNWEHRFGGARQHAVSLRASGVHTVGFGGDPGWYTPVLQDGTPIAPSRANFEPAAGLEYLPRGDRGWRPIVSYEGRLRTVYDYAKASADEKEDRQFSSSLILGVRNLAWTRRGAPDVIVKAYYGVNPHGQFRNQASYWLVGIGLLLRL
jgi:hypothetical protein